MIEPGLHVGENLEAVQVLYWRETRISKEHDQNHHTQTPHNAALKQRLSIGWRCFLALYMFNTLIQPKQAFY